MNAIEILNKLVSCNVIDAINFVSKYLENLKIKYELIPSKDGKNNTIFASIGNTSNKQGLILSGHLDVVPTTDQIWSYNPYVLTQKGDKLFGRGTSDMKGFVACVLSTLSKINISKLNRPVFLIFTYDEETSCNSVVEAIDYMRAKSIFPDQCIVGEPTEMFVHDKQKCCKDFKIIAKGKSGHASNSANGINAIYPIIELCGEICEFFSKNNTTFNIGSINGGVSFNIIPEYCEATVEYRANRDFDSDFFSIIDNFKLKHLEVKIDVVTEASMPHLESGVNALLKNTCVEIVGKNSQDEYSACTEAGFYSLAGIKTIVCGPGSLKQAHKENEFVTLQHLEECENFLKKLL
jgi:acetylornithine deacetylase